MSGLIDLLVHSSRLWFHQKGLKMVSICFSFFEKKLTKEGQILSKGFSTFRIIYKKGAAACASFDERSILLVVIIIE